ncbi:hypothetical protein DAPPUDRAFT_233103 [Daphnia pulex]|uniref:Uncharacterized protein n=1 Tax=Daphnia pulex TaxID=6669 RepID=E9FT74_DAPPU|nr:hypothetical protein DAPPUDRAFT_233103 [Daphnia pulex]|eukprot:EFX89698.1 hypothetical protein DAPPUDRAFT_233103 [Daphnia pulex]
MAEQKKKSECKCYAAGATESRRQWAPARRQEREQKTVVQQQQQPTYGRLSGRIERTNEEETSLVE